MSWMDESHFLELWYEKTQNPYFVWSAYRFFRNTNRPVPKWVLQYLDDSANDLLQGVNPLTALDFHQEGASNILNKFYQSIEHVYIVTEYAEITENEPAAIAKKMLSEKYQKSLAEIEQILMDAVKPAIESSD